jgi:hypothetical protein
MSNVSQNYLFQTTPFILKYIPQIIAGKKYNRNFAVFSIKTTSAQSSLVDDQL